VGQRRRLYTVSHPWELPLHRWLFAAGVLLTAGGLSVVCVDTVVVAGLVGSLTAMTDATAAEQYDIVSSARRSVLWFTGGLVLAMIGAFVLMPGAERPIAKICRVGMPPLPVYIGFSAVLTAVIGGSVEVVARLNLPGIPADLWDGLTGGVVYLAMIAGFSTYALCRAAEGKWQQAMVLVLQAGVMYGVSTLHPNRIMVQFDQAQLQVVGLTAAAVLLHWISDRTRPAIAVVRGASGPAAWQHWRIWGILGGRLVTVHPDRLTRATSAQMDTLVAHYQQLPEGWRQIAAQEQLVRIGAAARQVSRREQRGRPPGRPGTRLNELITELEHLYSGGDRPPDRVVRSK